MEEELDSVINSLKAHPDCEEDSEFADMVDTLMQVKAYIAELESENEALKKQSIHMAVDFALYAFAKAHKELILMLGSASGKAAKNFLYDVWLLYYNELSDKEKALKE